MVFNFFKNTSDNRKVNKALEKIAVGTSTSTVIRTNVIDRVTSAQTYITASSENSSYPSYGGFYATAPTNFNNPEINTCWLPTTEDETPYIKYEFSEAKVLNAITFKCFSNYSSDFVCNATITASNDDIDYTTLSTSEITGQLTTPTNIIFNLTNTTAYKYFKISFDRNLSVAYEPSLFIYDINANIIETVTVPSYDVNVIYKDDETKDNPTIEMAYNEALERANYAYCADTGYYFYLSEPTLSTQRLFFNCEVDLLMTYKDDILKLGCIIDRQEYEFNAYLVDEKAPILNRRVVNTLKFPVGFSNNDSYILATTGI